jgi:adenosylcobinamide-GDP ribazoletransferase
LKLQDFVTDVARATGFLSRLPVNGRYFVGYDGAMGQVVRAFPVSGALIALPAAATFAVMLAFHADGLLSALLALAVLTMVTGALHEDGLCDTADGLGGGRDRLRALEIMRDSRIGSFGGVALILSFGIRASALAAIAHALSPTQAGFALIAIAALSRAAMVWHWWQLPPARKDGVAATSGAPDLAALQVALASAAVIVVIAIGWSSGLSATLGALLGASLATVLFTRYIKRRLDGHTGDTIGASQQISEMAALSALAVLL